LRLELPVEADVPFKRDVRVHGQVRVPIDQRIAVPIKQRLEVAVPDALPVKVKVEGDVPARITSKLRIDANLGDDVRAQVGEVRLDGSSLSLRARGAGQ
ncbi:MAG TPA: hypothetical protein VFS00_28685, partial [Polyangiaceae bacterium]|nr:hypothetical protein [Polyangiaceae bacterium]